MTEQAHISRSPHAGKRRRIECTGVWRQFICSIAWRRKVGPSMSHECQVLRTFFVDSRYNCGILAIAKIWRNITNDEALYNIFH